MGPTKEKHTPERQEEAAMRIEFNRTGTERKELVKAIEKITEEKAKYLGTPSMAYRIGNFIVTKDGAVESEDSEAIELLVESLAFEGILSAGAADKADEKEESAEAPAGPLEIAISVPLEKVDVGNLMNLLEAKGELIKKALGIDSTSIQEEDERVTFPWFTDRTPEEVQTYTKFISALCKMSIDQKRISAKAKEVENEKYAFRCFLLRLGFIGDEFKEERKVLLKNLTGSSAFKRGAKGGDLA